VNSDAWHLQAIRLPDGDRLEELWFSRHGWQDHPIETAQDLPGRYVLPGFVDSHSHVSFGTGPGGPVPLELEGAAANLDRLAQSGVAVMRDAGGLPSVVLSLRATDGRPHLVPAGRHLAPRGRYFAAVHDPVESSDLVSVALEEVAAGARWVKVVADFPPVPAGAISASSRPEQTYDLVVLRDLLSAAHRAGARVAAHVTTPLVGDLVRLGFDSIEHGTEMTAEILAEMAQRGTAWVPTLCAVLSLPENTETERRRRVEERRERFTELLPLAVALGVPVLTGSDVVGTVPREIALLVECGLEPTDAMRAATSTAMQFLGTDALAAPPALVAFDDDPRDDPGVLTRPSAVVIGGVRIR
jgi:imidazolonepropionase-like amidohydrolase